ncbi:MAG: hypothetical protein ACF8SC_06435 [Phycisphaerales bacterium JB037]
MPPLARLRVAALAELAGQLRFASREALRRDLGRVEQLADEIEPDRLYPVAWVVERITGYRPADDDGTMLVGEAMLGDLSALVERLCDAAALTLEELGEVLDADALAARWGVSRKTLSRYRRRGLIARRGLDAEGRARLVFTPEAVARFESTQASAIERARRFTRIDDATESRVLERARRYAAAGLGLNEAAARIARRYGRSHEAVRLLLARSDDAGALFDRSGPMSDRERARAYRAWKRGAGAAESARRMSRPVSAVRRGIHIHRLARLERALTGAADPARDAGPEPTRIDPAAEGSSFGRALGADLVALLGEARSAGTPGAVRERHLDELLRASLTHARRTLGTVTRATPEASRLDAIETSLRRASRVKTELMRMQLPTLVRTLEARVHASAGIGKLESFSPESASSLVGAGLSALSSAVDEFRAGRGGRLAARAGLAIDRAAERWTREHARDLERLSGRAAPRWPDTVPMDDWSVRAHAWQRFLELPGDARRVLEGLDEELRVFAVLRFGWGVGGGSAELPRTLEECAAVLGAARIAMPRLERRVFAQVRELRRG